MKFYKTSLSGISLSKTGTAKNILTGKILVIGKRGYFTHQGKPVSMAKLMIETFKKIPQRTGQILFIDDDSRNFSADNVEYKTKLEKISPPSDKIIIEFIESWVGSDEVVNLKNIFIYRRKIEAILLKIGFFEIYKDLLYIEVFKDYFSINCPSYQDLAKRNKITVNDAKRTVFYFLNLLTERHHRDIYLRS